MSTIVKHFLNIEQPKLLIHCVIIAVCIFVTSCRSDKEMANDVLNTAIQLEKANLPLLENNKPASDSVKLSIQNSAHTNSVKKVPTQEELIVAHKVKTIKQVYNDGWILTTYDKKGNKIKEESDYSSKQTYTYEFDKNNKVTKEKRKFGDGSSFTYTYKYNEEGKLISKTFTDSDGKISLTTFEYNSELNTRKEKSSTGMDKEFYDNRGLRVRFESFDEGNKLVGYGEAKYNEDGLKVNEESFIIGMSTTDNMEYNEAGQLLKQHRTGILDVYFIFSYNEKGLIASEKNIKNHNEDVTLYEYTYY